MRVDQAIKIIELRRSGWYTSPKAYKGVKHIDFIHKSYRKNAYEEIILYLRKNGDRDSIEVLEEFRNMVDLFYYRKEDEETNLMFSICYDVATDMLDVLLEERWRKQNEKLRLH